MLVAVARGFRFVAWPAVVALVLAAGSGSALAQPEMMGNKNNVEEPYRRLQLSIDKYFTGEKIASGPTDKEAVEAATVAAKWFVYRMTWVTAQKALQETGSGDYFPRIVKEFDRSFMDYAVRSAPKNKAFMEIFSKQMIAAEKELMGKEFSDYKIAQINGAVLLPILARYGDEDVGDYLTEMLKDAKLHDALKVYALKGLRAFFKVRPPHVDPDRDDEKEARKRDAARVETVLAYMNRKPNDNAPPEEVEALRFIRREAIKALAETRVPALAVVKAKVQLPVALTLLSVLAPEKNGLAPSSSLTEKGEAAIGLCRIKGGVFEQYQPDAALYLIGRFLVEFATKYREDAINFGGKVKGERPPLLPWKYYSERLEQGLKELQANIPPQASAAYRTNLKVLTDHSLPLLGRMKRHDTIDEATPLENAVGKMWPNTPALGLFQGAPTVQIQLPALKDSP
jgi:hypothetical protein